MFSVAPIITGTCAVIATRSSAQDSAESKRTEDINKYIEVKDNPISAVGVYPYSGAQISSKLEPDKIYGVYRPEEELSRRETIESFKLVPFIDDHEMLGSEDDGLTPAERKGVHGVIGEDVYFDKKAQQLKGNLKIFAQKMKQLLADGKIELSAGYRCVYELVSGVYNGVPYDAIQRNIIANHLALVDEGRMGPGVAVLDQFKFTCDKAESVMADENKDKSTEPEKKTGDAEPEKKVEGKDEEVAGAEESKIDKIIRLLEAVVGGNGAAAGTAGVIDEKGDEDKKDGDTKKPAADADEEKKSEKAMDRKLSTAMDTVTQRVFDEVEKRDVLAEKLSNVIGVFDCKGKTLAQVVAYGMDQLKDKITAPKGQELTALNSYLAGISTSRITPVTTMDAAPKGEGMVSSYLEGVK